MERAVFLLREVFNHGYDEIARIVGKSEENCRQIAARARRQVDAKKPRFEASRARREELTRRFFEAVIKEDEQGLVELLAADVVAYGDGGGKAAVASPVPSTAGSGWRACCSGRRLKDNNAWALRGMRLAEVNGQPGAVFFDAEGQPARVVSLDIADNLVQTVRGVAHPGQAAASPFVHVIDRRSVGTAGSPWTLSAAGSASQSAEKSLRRPGVAVPRG